MKTKEKYELYKPKKFLGQNFLVDDNVARKITKQLENEPSDKIIEIGPGQGALTKHLIEYGDNFTAVEIDSSICKKLKKIYGEKLNLVNMDFLKYEITSEENQKIRIIGNIPYNITSEILFKLFDNKNKIQTAVLMIQKEVAERLVANFNTKEYGILAIQTQVNCLPEILFNVNKKSFFPKPLVNSAIVRLNFGLNQYSIEDYEIFRRVVRDSFGMRRKIMRNSLSKFIAELNLKYKDIDFDFQNRPESLRVLEFVQLANMIYDAHRNKK